MIPTHPSLVRSLCCALGLTLAATRGGLERAPSLTIDAVGRTDGHATLVWEPGGSDSAGELVFELQHAEPAHPGAFERCYVGPERGSFRSGLLAGTHVFRVRQRPADAPDGWGPWSSPASVEIEPHDLRFAWTLFALGGVLVAAIIGYLGVNELRNARAESEA